MQVAKYDMQVVTVDSAFTVQVIDYRTGECHYAKLFKDVGAFGSSICRAVVDGVEQPFLCSSRYELVRKAFGKVNMKGSMATDIVRCTPGDCVGGMELFTVRLVGNPARYRLVIENTSLVGIAERFVSFPYDIVGRLDNIWWGYFPLSFGYRLFLNFMTRPLSAAVPFQTYYIDFYKDRVSLSHCNRLKAMSLYSDIRDIMIGEDKCTVYSL